MRRSSCSTKGLTRPRCFGSSPRLTTTFTVSSVKFNWPDLREGHTYPWRIHGAGIYANIKGVYWWDPCYHIYIYIYIPYMDPMGIGKQTGKRCFSGAIRNSKTSKFTWDQMDVFQREETIGNPSFWRKMKKGTSMVSEFLGSQILDPHTLAGPTYPLVI